MDVKIETFKESDKKLTIVNRGFYRLYGYTITDESIDFDELMKNTLGLDEEYSLELIEINLQKYANGDISEKGLDNID